MLLDLPSFVKIMDITGRELYCAIFYAGSLVVTEHLNAGEYFISITNNSGTKIQRFTKR